MCHRHASCIFLALASVEVETSTQLVGADICELQVCGEAGRTQVAVVEACLTIEVMCVMVTTVREADGNNTGRMRS